MFICTSVCVCVYVTVCMLACMLACVFVPDPWRQYARYSSDGNNSPSKKERHSLKLLFDFVSETLHLEGGRGREMKGRKEGGRDGA